MDVNTLLRMLMKKKPTKKKAKTKTKKTKKTTTKKNKVKKTATKKKNNSTRRQKNCCPKGYMLQDNGSGVLTCVQQLITKIANNLLQNPMYLKNFYDNYGETRYYNDYSNTDSLYTPPRYYEYDDENSSSSSSRRKSDW